jgi:hypothetical protein
VQDTSDDDVPLNKASKPTTPKPRLKGKRTAYLMTPKTVRTRVTMASSQSSASHSLPPSKPRILQSDLDPEANRIFFESLAYIKKYVDFEQKTADIGALNSRIRQLAFYEVFPTVEWLEEFNESDEEKDIKVSYRKNMPGCV